MRQPLWVLYQPFAKARLHSERGACNEQAILLRIMYFEINNPGGHVSKAADFLAIFNSNGVSNHSLTHALVHLGLPPK